MTPPPDDAVASVPRATYRLQFHKGFRLADATRIVPYLASLGVSHIYASPILMARPGSTHGYDIVDHNRLNPEIGDEADLDALVAALRRHDMGLILDFVPNHMGVGPDNPWWMDVLEWGSASRYAAFFDIDWDPAEPTLAGKVLLPVLGDHYGAVLERGELALRFDADNGTFCIGYGDSHFPLAIDGYFAIAQRAVAIDPNIAPALDGIVALLGAAPSRGVAGRDAEMQARGTEIKRRLADAVARMSAVRDALDRALAAINGTPGQPSSFDSLHRLVERQHYRPAFWRVAAHEINYRRFFDINDLAAVRMAEPALFEESHRLVVRLYAEGKIQGLRLDHVDGLRDPRAYFARLQDTLAPNGGAPAYVLVEKILATHEHLRRDWRISGTTGYEFMNEVNGLFVDPAGARPLTRGYQRFLGRSADLDEIVIDAKRLIMREVLSSDLTVLANAFTRIAKRDRHTRDYSLIGLRAALSDVVAYFPVYRTYVTANGATAEDRRDIDWAVGRARSNARTPDLSVYDFIHSVLTLDLLARPGRSYRRPDIVEAALKFQQYTGPLMAKALEDTAFYRYVPLVSLNEVGGDPARFGIVPAAFHADNQRRRETYPASMVTTSTHDHKRGEDVRARLNVISEIPRLWLARVQRWARFNRRKRGEVDGRPAPGRNDEYLFYQTLVGAWPFELAGPDFPGIDAFFERVAAYMLKAAREAKARTSWAAPDSAYEEAMSRFIARVLDPAVSRPFLEDVAALVEGIAAAGAVNGLAQALLKLTVPGVPDIYQGTEQWDFSLVDPDNRRPVDYRCRAAGLAAPPDAGTLLASWRDGLVKQHVVRTALALRRQRPALFAAGDYVPMAVEGAFPGRAVAFARTHQGAVAIAVVPRLVQPMMQGAALPLPAGWEDTRVVLPEECGDGMRLHDLLTGEAVEAGPGRTLPLHRLLSRLPVALLSTESLE